MPTLQISTHIAEETKQRLDRVARKLKRTRAQVIEDALGAFFREIEAVPEEFLIPEVIVLTEESAARVAERIENGTGKPPSAEMLKLRGY